MKRSKFRSKPILMTSSNLDRANNRITNVVAMQTGEAQGHGMVADQKTLQMMALLGNNRPRGVDGRFGHPGISENAMGKKLFTANNFRVEGDKLRHSIDFYDWAKLSPVFQQDPVEYVFSRAELNPESFGESVVIQLDEVWVLDDGQEIPVYEKDEDGYPNSNPRPENAIYDLPVMRPITFYYVDIVSDGALTPNGMFSAEADVLKMLFEGTSSHYAEQAFRLLDDFTDEFGLSADELAQKVPQIIKRYQHWRGFDMPQNAQDETPLAQTESPAPEKHDELQAVLAEAEALNADIEAAEVEDKTPEIDGVSLAEHEAVKKELAEFKQAFVAFAKEANRQNRALLEAFTKLKDDFTKLNGEEVVTGKVPANSPFDQLAQLQAQQFAALPDPVQQRQANTGAIMSDNKTDRMLEQQNPSFGFSN